MPKGNETTTKFKVDISELKKSMQEARKQVAYANSEFKATSSTMDDWSKSSDGISAKLKQLNSNLKSQETVLAEYEKTLEEVKKEYGENSKEALEYATKLNNQKAVVNKIKKEIAGYEDALKEVSDAEKIASKTGKDVADVLDEAGKEAEDAGDGFTVLKGAVADFVGNALTQLVDGLKNGISSLVSFSDEADKAMNDLTAKTGLYTEDMERFDGVMKNIYNANYGESFEDIADAMGEVMTQSWDWGTENIEKVTTNALTLRDTFDYDVAESVRAVNMLMEQFGITSDEAFNLIARGTQVGLNKNGDLLDVINEYGVHYSQMGASAEEFFYSLNNGASEGVFSVDKLGDAYKEFGIRTKDTASSTDEAYELLGLNADKMRAKFAEGGESARQASSEVVEALFSMDDQVKQNQAGVGLFGTMWEDLGKDAIESLMQISEDGSDSFMDLYETMDEINAIKYNSVGEALQGLGRNLQTGVLMPIGDKLLPIVSDLAIKFQEWLNDPATQEGIKQFTDSVAEFVDNGLQAIKDGVSWFLENKDAVIAGLAGIASGFVAFKVVTLIQALVSAFNAWRLATEGMTIAQRLLNLVMNANPIGIIVTLIATVVGALITFIATNEEARAKISELWQKIKDGVGQKIEEIGKFFTETLPEFIDKAVEFFSQLPSKIWTWLVNTITKIVQWRNDMIAKAKETASSFINKVIEYVSQLPSKIWTWLSNVISKVKSWAGDLASKGREAGQGLLDSIVNIAKQIPDRMVSIGSDVISGLWNGISGAIGGLYNNIKESLSGLVDKAKDALGIHSPSRVFADEVGKWIPAGIAVGIDKNVKTALNSVKDLAINSLGSARAGLNTANTTLGGASVGGGVVNNFTQNNYSPKPLSRLDIYRQSKNLLGYAGGGFNV